MSESGFRILAHDAGPWAYAKRLASYISDASTVRVRTLERYGRAPAVKEIAKMIEARIKDADKRRADARRRYGDYDAAPVKTHYECGHKITRLNTVSVDGAGECKTCLLKAVNERVASARAARRALSKAKAEDEHKARRRGMAAIIAAAARITRLPVEIIASSGRGTNRTITHIRSAIAIVGRAHGFNQSEIGRALRMDHTSIYYYYSREAHWRAECEWLNPLIDQIGQEIRDADYLACAPQGTS